MHDSRIIVVVVMVKPYGPLETAQVSSMMAIRTYENCAVSMLLHCQAWLHRACRQSKSLAVLYLKSHPTPCNSQV